MKRPLIVIMLLIGFACTSSEPTHRGPWTIESLSRKALEKYVRDAPSEERESPDAAFAAPATEAPRRRDSGVSAEGVDDSEEMEEVEDFDVDGVEEGDDESPLFGGQAEEAPRRRSARRATTKRTWRRSQLVPNTSKLSIGTKEELPLEKTKVSVRVDGFRARVKLDLFYRNDRDKQLQGTLKLRLPDGASPTATAFGALPAIEAGTPPESATLKHARIVPREKAAHAYGETVRRKIDPALVEWAGSGIYNVKVFPLEPSKLHQVSVSYDVDLTPVGDALEYRLDLPEKAGEVTVDIRVQARQHALNGGAPAADGHYQFAQPAERSFVVRVQNPGAIVLTGDDPATGPLYAVRFAPDIPDEHGPTNEHAVFLLDTSLSSNPARFNIWLDLMEEILTRNRPSIREFHVGFFNIGVHWWRDGATPNTRENVLEALAFAKSLSLEGATDLGNALQACGQFTQQHDLFLLSDGAATWGERDPLPLLINIPDSATVFAYRTGLEGTDSATLGRIANASGGAVFTLTGETALKAAAVAHTKRPWTVHEVTGPGTDVILAGRPTTVFPGQSLIAAGRGKWQGEFKLHLRQGERQHTITVKHDEMLASPLTRGIYGQIAVRQFEVLGTAAERAARAYALHFGVVGKTCSLLMLDTEEDYARFDIKQADEQEYVRETEAHAETLAAVERLARSTVDQGARLTAWLKRLETMPGMEFVPNEHVLAALQALPTQRARPLRRVPARLWSDLPGAVQEQLASRKLDYDAIVAEATRRKDTDGIRALSSLIEQNPGNLDVARDVGYTALAWGHGADVYDLFRSVAEKRPYEPSSYLAMARCLEGEGRIELAKLWYEVALAGEWNERFGAFRTIATVHYLSFLRRHKDDRLETLVPTVETPEADLIVSVFWNTDRSDVDLYVRDANGEVCSYNHTETKMNGRITEDVTEGFGPEMFVLEEADPGEYAAWVNYFSEDSTQMSTRTRIFTTVFENWGRANEKAHYRVIELATGKEHHPIALMTRNRQ